MVFFPYDTFSPFKYMFKYTHKHTDRDIRNPWTKTHTHTHLVQWTSWLLAVGTIVTAHQRPSTRSTPSSATEKSREALPLRNKMGALRSSLRNSSKILVPAYPVL